MSENSLSLIISRSDKPVDALASAGEWFARSGLFGCERKEQGAILALTCMSENISPVAFARTYDVVEGKLRKKAMAAFAEFRVRGGKVKWLATGDDGKEAEAEFIWEGQTITCSFTIEQARLAGLVKDRSGWVKNPANMLRARVVSNALGMLAPEIYAGSYYDRDDEQPPAPREMNLAGTAPATVTVSPSKPEAPASTAPAPLTVDVVAEPVQHAPTASVAPAAAVSAPAPIPAVGKDITPETAGALASALGPERIPAAVAYCRSIGWITADQTLEDLRERHAKGILARLPAFLAKIGGEK